MKARRTTSPPDASPAPLPAEPRRTCAVASWLPVAGGLLALAVASPGARASAPLVDDLVGATPLRTEVPAAPVPTAPAAPVPAGPADGGRPALSSPPGGAPATGAPDRGRASVFLHGRWVTLPDGLLGAFFETHPSYSQPAAALAIETGETDGNVWAFEAGWIPLIPAAGNWQKRLSAPNTSSYVVSNVHMLTLDATYRHQFEAGEIFRGFLGGGVGVGVLVGNATSDEVLPDCAAPASACAHWPSASRKTVDLPARLLPVLHVTGGFEVDLGDRLTLRLSGGFKNVLYAGLGLGFQL